MSKSKEFSEWENDDINSWLESIGLEQNIEYSKRNDVTGYDLCKASNEELKKIFGINNQRDYSILTKNIRYKFLELGRIH
jgi:hypothetical protein